ncbi:enoyl-CoA hydratase/isomerase family protein [Rhodovulum sp. 12E13]|uniref:enoyl-CoA hydratase/isomerase family protein n=1 Tax=Rhodovulum sp. 12E13 TaxID=2203891 RepID=UPI000E18632A|nr:enoyl-CoA hydratase/isomerase family protein [Rhodovulum sp. 12E13]RDC74754.1 enoyl-CoA hydratase/isomerase family protein [Rhodovulum sp. 12E13]
MIRLDRDGPVWTLTLDRPDKANALTREMLVQIRDAAAEAEQAGLAALILTGTGKVFSSGADIDAARAGLATDGVWEEVSSRIARLPFLTVAALNGTLAGGAFGMALACDLRLAVPGASFFYPVMRLGFLPQPSDPARLAALIGPSRARMLLMAGQKIDAETALAWGLVDRIVPREALVEEARALAEAPVAAPEHIRRTIKRMIRG